MPSISPDGRGLRPFVQAAYTDGQLTCSILDCPFAGSGEPCSVVVHARRSRKTGPMHALVVLRCMVHGHAFTVYPSGFVPYARRQLVDGPVQHGIPSLCDVIEDAAENGPRDRLPTGDAQGSWSTQRRLLDRASRLFGLEALDRRIEVSATLGLPLTDLEAAAVVHGTAARGAALRRLSASLQPDDLLVLGVLAGCWGEPHRWLTDRDQLVALPLARGPPTTSVR